MKVSVWLLEFEKKKSVERKQVDECLRTKKVGKKYDNLYLNMNMKQTLQLGVHRIWNFRTKIRTKFPAGLGIQTNFLSGIRDKSLSVVNCHDRINFDPGNWNKIFYYS